MVDGVSMVGECAVRRPAKQPREGKERRWKKRRDGIWQRYWYKVTGKGGFEEVIVLRRFEFYGYNRDIGSAIIKALHGFWVPMEEMVEVNAGDFLKDPSKYSEKGRWVRFNVVS